MSPRLTKIAVVLVLFIWHACGLHLVPRSTPLISRQDFDQIPWSRDNLRLSHKEHVYIYHNYTVITDDNGAARVRYLHREVIPYHRRVFRSRLYRTPDLHNHQTRGIIANPNVPKSEIDAFTGKPHRWVTWNWQRDPRGECAAQIPFCFINEISKNKLLLYLNKAIEAWHDALGEYRGVELVMTKGDAATGLPAGICYDRSGSGTRWGTGVPTDAVVIVNNEQDEIQYSSLGWQPPEKGKPRAGRMRIDFSVVPEWTEEKNVINMAHEIGHVMGLDHEHQRYDAGRYIEVVYDNVKNIENLEAKIPDFENTILTPPLKKEELMKNWWLMYRMEVLMGTKGLPRLASLLPYERGDHLDIDLVDLELEGPFDWDSIMIYQSYTHAKSPIHPTLREVSPYTRYPFGTWGMNLKISEGDSESVQLIVTHVDMLTDDL